LITKILAMSQPGNGARSKTLPTILDYDSQTYRQSPIRSALTDFATAFRQVDLWTTMGWLDVRQRYRRSVLGPFWVTLSLAAFVGGLGITYGALFGQNLSDYLPYLCVGIVVWSMLSNFILEGCQTFIGAESVIKQMPGPLSMHAIRLVWRHFITFLHNVVIIALTFLIFGINPGAVGFVSLIGLALVLLNGFAFALSFGTISARFRDIPPLMGNVTQTLFFVTPVIWHIDNLKERRIIADWNPIYHLIEIVRAPLLGAWPTAENWSFALVFTLVNTVVALVIYARFRWRIPYWL
jgi:ABC-type polysaccharide/polyol phosphate export permease